jgi:hypothetical protein
MTSPTGLLAQQATLLAEKVGGLIVDGPDLPLAEAFTGTTDAALLALLTSIGNGARLLDAVGARIAGEIARRSTREQEQPLAKRMGEKSAADLISAQTGLGMSRAVDWSRIGTRLAPRTALTGQVLPPEYPVVASALDEGDLSLDQARVILDALVAIKPYVDLDESSRVEEYLVGQAVLLSVSGLMKLCRVLPDRFSPDGIEPREEELRALAGSRLFHRRNGMLRLVTDFDPEGAGYLNAALDARMAPRRQVAFVDEDDPAIDPVLEDTRTMSQRRYDAVVGIVKDSLRADEGTLSGVSATLLVTIDQEALRTGVGSAMIADVDTPVSVATARRIACDARIIPVVLGGASQPLDLGVSRRLFSEAQRLAMAVRDGGCIWPGCGAPPGRCEAAHLKPWRDGGRTSIDNGILLCPFHHRRFDIDGWELLQKDGQRWLVPPPWADASRRPRLIPPRSELGRATS